MLEIKHFVCVAAISQTTSNTTSSGGSTTSGNSRFSAASGSEDSYPNGQILPHPNLRIFSFSELRTATRNFRGDTVLGEGGFGKVYKGWLDEKSSSRGGSGSVIAVKKLNSESMQGFEEWQVKNQPTFHFLTIILDSNGSINLLIPCFLFAVRSELSWKAFSPKPCQALGVLLGRKRVTSCL